MKNEEFDPVGIWCRRPFELLITNYELLVGYSSSEIDIWLLDEFDPYGNLIAKRIEDLIAAQIEDLIPAGIWSRSELKIWLLRKFVVNYSGINLPWIAEGIKFLKGIKFR